MRFALPRIPAIAVLSASLLGSAQAQERVTIEGGNDGSGQNYEWTVTNRHTSPIVSIVFPHYQADTFTPPAGWRQKCTNLAVIGSADEPGECRGYVEPPTPGIAPGASDKFRIRLARVGAAKGSGTVTVQFADGTSAQISGVTLPTAQSGWEKSLMPVAMGALLLLALLIARRKKRGDEPNLAGPPESA